MNKNIEKYNIWIVNSSHEKNKLLDTFKKLTNIKLITLDELRKKYYFDYNKESIYYLMKKYNYQIDVAKMYLSHIYEVDKDYNNEKNNKILSIKKELDNNNLLIKTPLFKEYLKHNKILAYNLNNLNKQDQKMLDEISKISPIYYYEEEKEYYKHNFIITCKTKEEEVSYVAGQISKLIKNNIDIKDIKVYASHEYENIIRIIFSYFNLKTSLSKNTLYTTKLGKIFINNLNLTKEECLTILENSISKNNNDDITIYNQIINTLNNYTWCNSLKELTPFIINDLKNINLEEPIDTNIIEVVNDIESLNNNDYVFILGFNQGEIPINVKDEDYFNDEEKRILKLDTTEEINKINKHIWLEKINIIKNLTITMKKNNDTGECYISNLNDELNLKEIEMTEDYSSSNLYNKLELSKKLDTLTKYNELEPNIELLYNNYPNIHYNTFNNNYQNIEKTRIRKYLNNNLTLSYSSMNTYYQCSFRYYLNNILRLNIYEESFYTIIGNLFHHILSMYYTKEIDIKKEYQKYINSQKYPFNKRELYFLKKLEPELEFIINTINKQNETNSLTNIITEKEVTIKKKYEDMNVTFKGYVDKIMTNDKKDLISIVDYKTGTPNLNLNNIIYGLDLQLPTYLYLSKELFKNSRIVGFYLQKLLNPELKKDKNHDYNKMKEDTLKLQGYSNSDLSILAQFDSNYQNSNMIKGMRTTCKGLSTKKVLDDTKIDYLIKITNQKIDEAIENISNANFDINPKRVGMENLGCLYCEYKDICYKTEKNIVSLKEYKNMEFLGDDDNDTNETRKCNMDQ